MYQVYIDREALLYMFAAPLAISLIMGFAFGGLNDGDVNLPESEVRIVNQDEGQFGLGETYENALIDTGDEELEELVAAETSTDREAARQAVEDGDIRAMVYVPPDFSNNVIGGEGSQVEFFYNPESEIGVTITRSIVQSITDSLNTVLVGQQLLPSEADRIQQMVTGAGGEGDAAQENPQQGILSYVAMRPQNVSGDDNGSSVLAYFAPAMAILFMTFAMAGGARDILEERRDWTMQRILTTPTPRWAFMSGKQIGIYITGVLQMLILLLVTPLVAVATGGELTMWGDNYIGLALMTLSVVLAGTGLALLITGAAKTVEQADTLSTGTLFVMAMIGGSFVQVDNVPVLKQLSWLTLNYWGINGYDDLANNNATLVEVLPHIGILFLMGIGFFLVALWRFNRRLDI